VLKDLAEKFDAFGREASVFFERRARLISILVAIAVAWFLYVNPYDLFSTYLARPEVAEKVIARQETVIAQYEQRVSEAQTRLDTATALAATKEKEAKADEKDESKKAALKAATDDESAALAARDKAMQDAKDAKRDLQDVGVPIGWTQQRLTAAGFSQASVLGIRIPYPSETNSMPTALWLIVGGLLVGLGGPFWYDLIKSLSGIRAFGTATTGQADGGTPTAPGVEPESPQPQTPVEHFKIGAAGRVASSVQPPAKPQDQTARNKR
jgi:hypothetical protein